MKKHKCYYLTIWDNDILVVFRHKRNIPYGFRRIGRFTNPYFEEIAEDGISKKYNLVVFGNYDYAKKICPNMKIYKPSVCSNTYVITTELLFRHKVKKDYLRIREVATVHSGEEYAISNSSGTINYETTDGYRKRYNKPDSASINYE